MEKKIKNICVGLMAVIVMCVACFWAYSIGNSNGYRRGHYVGFDSGWCSAGGEEKPVSVDYVYHLAEIDDGITVHYVR